MKLIMENWRKFIVEQMAMPDAGAMGAANRLKTVYEIGPKLYQAAKKDGYWGVMELLADEAPKAHIAGALWADALRPLAIEATSKSAVEEAESRAVDPRIGMAMTVYKFLKNRFKE